MRCGPGAAAQYPGFELCDHGRGNGGADGQAPGRAHRHRRVAGRQPGHDRLAVPSVHNEIKMGAQLVVRESQTAVFVNEGQIADVFPPGTYTLETQNMPILSTLKGWKYGFNSPFKAEVYFVNTRQFTDMKWGTQNPVILRDAEFGVVRVRAFGAYAARVVDAPRAAAGAGRHRPAVPHRGGAGVPAAVDRRAARRRAGHGRGAAAGPRRTPGHDRPHGWPPC